MNRGPCFVAIIALSLTLSSARADTKSDQLIVDRFFPAALKNGARVHADHLLAKWSRASLDKPGEKDSIVALYTNGNHAALTVISAAPGATPRVISTVATNEMTGIASRLELIDLDADGIPEIAALLGAAGGSHRTWLYKWSKKSLQPLGPTTTGHRGSRVTLLADPLFVDVNGDGTHDAINFPDEEMASHNPADVYLLRRGTYSPADFEVVFYDVFVRRVGGAQEELVSFPIHDTGSRYVVRILNGGHEGERMVSSVDVAVNGRSYFKSDFPKAGSLTSIPLELKHSNTIRVLVEGVEGSFVRLLVERHRSRSK